MIKKNEPLKNNIISERKQKLLEVRDLEVKYIVDNEVVRAVNGVSFDICHGETLGLVGETGAGKTTTALSIIRLISDPPGKIVKGEIYYEGENLLDKSERQMRKIRGQDITMIFQDPMTSLNPLISIGDQIMEVVRLHEKTSKMNAILKSKKMLEIVGIKGDRYDEYPHQFSGGMKQRVMIAMSLACNPKLLIADESTTALDVTVQAQILNLMNDLKKEFNTAMIMITHDLGVVAEVCDKVAIMYAGEIVEYGTLEDIFNNPLHPYTKGLFSCIPDLQKDLERLETIRGMGPSPTDLPNGCKFHPRCNYYSKECDSTNIKVVEVTKGHKVKCILCSGQ
ncbi:MAG: ABC transporter ATP-binding protein [Lachnotalea sp.]